MEVFEIVIALLLVGAALAALARRIGAPYPALVALAGAAVALVPGAPTITLDPELALALFVAPVLVDAAFDSSLRDMRDNWRAISSLAVGAVLLTVGAVAIVARMLVPELPWAAGIALGAIVAPPDAAAATAVLKVLRPPNRILVVLEGESLFNDATALLIYRMAVGATMTGFISGWSVVPMLLIVTVGSVVFGLVLTRLMYAINRRITDVSTAIIVQFCGCFLVWILAEQMHLSAIITLVVFAMAASREAPKYLAARMRVPTWAVWEVAVFVLNVLAFILVGFQLKHIAGRITAGTGIWYATFAGVLTMTVIVARIAWVSGAAWFSRWRCRPRVDGAPGPKDAVALSGKNAVVVGWCGMRGTVTLAAALALPIEFPQRDLILTTAFGVTLGTLVFQGLTLRPLMLRLRLEDDHIVEREVKLGRVETLRAAMAAVARQPGDGAAELVRQRYAKQLERAEAGLNGTSIPPDADGDIVRAAMSAQRNELIALRTKGTIGDAAFQQLQEELDLTELGWQQVVEMERAE